MFKKMMNQAIVTLLRLLALRSKKDNYPAGLKYERRESFKSLIKKYNNKTDDKK